MALGDLPVDQTKTPKKKPLVSQQVQGGAGGVNTAAAGSNNMQVGRQGAYTLPTPVIGSAPSVQRDRAGGIIKDTSTPTSTRGTSVPGVKRVGDVFSGTTGSWDAPPPSTIPLAATTPSQQSLDTQQQTITPSFGVAGMNKATPALGDTGSYISTEGGVKTLHVGGGTISSSSPKFGLSTPQRLADLDQTIANDRNPQIIANRAAEAARVQKRFDDSLRGGLSRADYENPLGSTQLMKGLQEARARNDIVGFGMYRDLLKEQLGNETTRAGQNVTAQGNLLSTQSDIAKLGQAQAQAQQTFEATQKNKGIEQSIDVQKAQASIEKNVSDLINSPEYMNESKSPSQTFSDVNRLGGDVSKSLDSIVGPQTANAFRNERDINRRAQLLQSMGLSPDQVTLMLTRYQQQ